MSDATDSKAWPATKFFGEPERYAQYATDQEGWAITNDDDEFLESRDPSTIPRVEAAYTVQSGVTDDPHGPPGTNVQSETVGNYNRRIARVIVELRCARKCQPTGSWLLRLLHAQPRVGRVSPPVPHNRVDELELAQSAQLYANCAV